MKIRKTKALTLCAASLGCLLLLAALGCATRPAALRPDDPLFGTWVNEEAERLGRGAAAKSVFFPDGRELVYQHITDAEPMGESEDTVEKSWIDSEGNHWYHIHWVGWGYDDPEQKWEGFSLVKVSAAGTVQEGMWNRFGYPEELDPLSPDYFVSYKRP